MQCAARQHKIGRKSRRPLHRVLPEPRIINLGSRPGIGQRFPPSADHGRARENRQTAGRGSEARPLSRSDINDVHGPFELLRVPTFGTKWKLLELSRAR